MKAASGVFNMWHWVLEYAGNLLLIMVALIMSYVVYCLFAYDDVLIVEKIFIIKVLDAIVLVTCIAVGTINLIKDVRRNRRL